MEERNRTVSELSSLFRMIQVIPDADSVARVYQMLLAFCTTWRTIGFERAFLFLPEPREGMIRGQLAAEEAPLPPGGHGSPESFEVLAKSVFENYEKIETSDLTLRTRAYSVPLDGRPSAVVKAVQTGYPVLAESGAGEFAADPFFESFGTACYISVPIRASGRVMAVLAADNARTGSPISVDDVSMLHGLAQQAGLAIERLLEASENRLRFRVLRKVQDTLEGAKSAEQVGEALNVSLSMICRAVGADGCILRDYIRNKTLHIKSVDEYTVEAGDSDVAIGVCFERIMDRCAGGMRPVRGDSQHPLLDDVASERVRFFHAVPIVVAGDGVGSLAVYVEKDDDNHDRSKLDAKNRTFVELCAGMVGERLGTLHLSGRLERAEAILEEMRANLTREKDSSRLGDRALDFYESLSSHIESLHGVLFSRIPFEKRVARAKELLEEIGLVRAEQVDSLERMKSSLTMVRLFSLVDDAVRSWSSTMGERGIEMTVRIPQGGPSLLMNRESMRTAVDSILSAVSAYVARGDRVLVECSATDDKAVVLFADTGRGMPGHLLSRLFMPFGNLEEDDERRSAMSLAGDILHRHSGEIALKSSPSSKTILVVTFPVSPNRDRRRSRRDRRRRSDRREPAPTT